jgi:hypothetical protein
MAVKSDFQYIWIFMGKGSWSPTAVFNTFDEADAWISGLKLTGYLSEYPIGISVYNWALAMGLHKPKFESQKSAAHIEKFGSSFLTHYHYENGSMGASPDES